MDSLLYKNIRETKITKVPEFLNEFQRSQYTLLLDHYMFIEHVSSGNLKKILQYKRKPSFNINLVIEDDAWFNKISLIDEKFNFTLTILENFCVDVNLRNGEGQTLLMNLFEDKDLKLIKYICENYTVNYNIRDNYGKSVLDYSRQYEQDDLIKFYEKFSSENIIEDCIKFNDFSALKYVKNFNLTCENISCLDSYLENIDINKEIPCLDEFLLNNLIYCNNKTSSKTQLMILKSLIDKFKCINWECKDIIRCLQIDRLMYKGCNLLNPNNKFMIHNAFIYNDKTLVKFFVLNKADVFLRNGEGLTPLHIAAYGNIETLKFIKFIYNEKFNYNVLDREGRSMLHYACMHDRLNNFIYLSTFKWDSLLDANRRDCLTIATLNNSTKIINYLLKNGQECVEDVFGKTFIDYALQFNINITRTGKRKNEDRF